MTFRSLRARLIVIILTPLLVFATVAAMWQFRLTTDRAEDIFDRGLLSAALAISRDVAISGGDALLPATRGLVSDTSGGEVFYHVFAPDGVFVTGYSTPPTPPRSAEATTPYFYDGTYQGRPVRVLRFGDATTIDGVTGLFTISVWQDQSVRNGFVRDVLARTVGMIALLVLLVALIVWFGVGLGLRPLLELQEAIARRTPSDLTPIRRAVPAEAEGIVATLNDLLGRVSRRISSKDEFISNAAHQLRNPIAGVLALAEAVRNARTPEAASERSQELVIATRDAAHLTNQLLSFERANGSDTGRDGQKVDMAALCRATMERFSQQNAGALSDIALDAQLPDTPITLFGDKLMLEETVLNLLTNALVHGGPGLGQIGLALTCQGDTITLQISDDGVGISPDQRERAISRFSQANAGPGSGLGLPVAIRVAENHGGRLSFAEAGQGLAVVLELPRERPQAVGVAIAGQTA